MCLEIEAIFVADKQKATLVAYLRLLRLAAQVGIEFVSFQPTNPETGMSSKGHFPSNNLSADESTYGCLVNKLCGLSANGGMKPLLVAFHAGRRAPPTTHYQN